jgi:hypothetical protein
MAALSGFAHFEHEPAEALLFLFENFGRAPLALINFGYPGAAWRQALQALQVLRTIRTAMSGSGVEAAMEAVTSTSKLLAVSGPIMGPP